MRLIELQQGRTRATVAPDAGGRLLQLAILDGSDWLPLLHVPLDPESLLAAPTSGGSFPMAPWPGRIDGGRFQSDGRQYAVPANAPGGHAIHGFGVYGPWRVESASADACRLAFEFPEAWPFGGDAAQEIAVSDGAISLTMEIRARGAERFPAGAGWHPWFRRDVRPGRDVEILLDADATYETVDMIPTGWLPAVRGETDLRAYPASGERRLDTCYRDVRAAALRWGDVELRMESSPNITHAVVFTPAAAVCLEPQTCAPDAFNLATQGIEGCGMAVVDARHPLVATTRWTIGVGR